MQTMSATNGVTPRRTSACFATHPAPGAGAQSSRPTAGLTDIPESVIDIDIMIGEQEAVGRGAGSAALRLVAETALCDPGVPFAMACIRVGNVASLRACVKAGFRRDREFDDVPNGRYMLMVCHRQPTRSP